MCSLFAEGSLLMLPKLICIFKKSTWRFNFSQTSDVCAIACSSLSLLFVLVRRSTRPDYRQLRRYEHSSPFQIHIHNTLISMQISLKSCLECFVQLYITETYCFQYERLQLYPLIVTFAQMSPQITIKVNIKSQMSHDTKSLILDGIQWHKKIHLKVDI